MKNEFLWSLGIFFLLIKKSFFWAPPVGWCCYEVMDVIAARKQNKKNNIVLVHWEICFRQILYLFKGNLIFPLIWWCRCEMMDVIATGECWAKSSQGQGCQTFSRLIINITNYTDEELEDDGDDEEYIQGWRERALKAQGGPIPQDWLWASHQTQHQPPLTLFYIRKEFQSWTER